MRPVFLLPLMLAACNQPSDTSTPANTASAEPAGFSNLQQAVVDLPEEQRLGVFLRAIRDGDAPCQGVTEATRQPDQDGRPVYVARCTDGPIYAVAISAEGVAQVTRLSPERR